MPQDASAGIDRRSLLRAIANQELELDFQPQVELKTGRVSGVEALIRWNHPDMGRVMPDEFIALAERTGLSHRLLLWVMSESLRQVREWRGAGIEVPVSVNMSASDLYSDEQADAVASLLKRWDAQPEWLELEITESAVLLDLESASRILSRFRAMGIGLALDDFGTRYSSLEYLRWIPVTRIKLDKSFVMGISSNATDARIVGSTIDLAHQLKLRVVAEGIENRDIWRRLAVLGCDSGQGYFIGRPMPSSELQTWFKDWKGADSGRDVASNEAGKTAALSQTTRVLVVDDHTLVRESLVKTVSSEPGFEVVGQGSNRTSALQAASESPPDLTLMDIALPGCDGLDLAVELRANLPGLRVLFLTMCDDEETIRRAVELGADGYVTKSATASELVEAIHAVAQGGSYLSPSIARKVLSLAKADTAQGRG